MTAPFVPNWPQVKRLPPLLRLSESPATLYIHSIIWDNNNDVNLSSVSFNSPGSLSFGASERSVHLQ